jgi:outer membrane protein assembly factor BamB
MIEHRIMIVPEDASEAFDLDAARDVAEGRYSTLRAEVSRTALTLNETATDITGSLIVEGVPYVAFVASASDDTVLALSAGSKPVTLVNETIVRTLVPELESATGGVVVGPDGNLYVADIGRAPARQGTTIHRISPEGEVSVFVEGEGLLGASGNAFDSDDNLYQSSISANTISRITPDGTVTIFATDGIFSPVGITIDADDTLYVANCGGGGIQRVTQDGESTRFASDALFSCANGITLDPAGNIYVANFRNGRVLKVTPDAEVSEFAELPGYNNGHITYGNGVLYVVSRGGHQVYTLTLDGELALLAGTGERGHDDGPARDATFSLPNDIAISLDGRRLYVNEVFPTTGSANTPSTIRVIILARR